MSLHSERVLQGYNPAFLRMVKAKRKAERARQIEERRRELAAMVKVEEPAIVVAPVPVVKPANTVVRRDPIEVKIRRLTGAGPKFIRIAARICRVFDAQPSEVFSRRRNREIALVRQAICYWLCRLTPFSLPQIGRMIGIDHTSVLHNRDAYVVKRRAQGRYLRPAR